MLVGVVVAVSFSYAVRQENQTVWENWSRVAVGAALAFPLLFAASVLRARGAIPNTTRWLLSAAVVGGALLYAALVWDPQHVTERWRAAALVGALALGLLLLPRVRENPSRTTLWHFAAELTGRAVLVLGYAAVLYALLSLAVHAVSVLFEVRIPEHLYMHLAGIIFFALAPWLLTGAIPTLADDTAPAALPRTVRFLGKYGYLPVLTLYLGIVYAYAVRVLVTGEFPKNLLSPLVLAAGLVGFGGAVLLEPLHTEPDHRGVSRLIHWLPTLMLAPLLWAAWALAIRTLQYGWTEFRYLRMALLGGLGVLAVWGTVRLLQRKPPLLAAVPLVLAATLLFSAVGPWSASAVSRRDQQNRLRQGLGEAGLLRGGRFTGQFLSRESVTTPVRITLSQAGVWQPVPLRTDDVRRIEVPGSVHRQIESATVYLWQHHGPASLRSMLGGVVDHIDREPVEGVVLARRIPVRSRCEHHYPGSVRADLPPTTTIRGVPGGTWVRFAVRREEGGNMPRSQPAEVRVSLREDRIEVTPGRGGVWRGSADLKPLARRFAGLITSQCGRETPTYASPELSVAEAMHPVVEASGRRRGMVLLTTVLYSRAADRPQPGVSDPGPTGIESVEGWLILAPTAPGLEP